MRALELLRAFSDKEMAEIELLVKQKNRKSLHLLLQALKPYRRRKTTPPNTELHLKAFNEKHTPQNSYVLRHELRLLSEVMYDYLVLESFKEYGFKNKTTYQHWLVRGLYNRQITEVFEAEVDRFIEAGKRDIRPDDTAAILHYKSLWLIRHQKKTIDNLQYQLKVLDELVDEQVRFIKYRMREAEARRAFIEKGLKALLEQERDVQRLLRKTEPAPFISLTQPDPTGWFEEYLILKKFASQTEGAERIEIMKQMLLVEQSDDFKGEFPFTAQIVSMSNIATELILLNRFEEADYYLNEGIALCEKNKHPVAIGNLQNYIANQLNLARYEKGIALYHKYRPIIVNSRNYTAITLYKCYCHLFLGQGDEALKSLPVDSQTTEQEHLMIRTIYPIVFCLRADYELALNECNNITKRLRGKKGWAADRYKTINTLFIKYLNAILRKTEKDNKLLAAEMDSRQSFIATYSKTEFTLLWLVGQINRYRHSLTGI